MYAMCSRAEIVNVNTLNDIFVNRIVRQDDIQGGQRHADVDTIEVPCRCGAILQDNPELNR